MDNAVNCYSTPLIYGDGTFNAIGLERFISTTKFNECGQSYFVVSIIGRQATGKSTLLNQLFGTNFVEMNASRGRSQTTLGVWMAKAVSTEPFTVVMDFEGSDGRERGEDDTAFEKQIALFALVVSDVLLINMWCTDIGLEQGSNKPLLRIILQVYVTKLYHPRKTTPNTPLKMTLMFVVRDKTESPLELLRRTLLDDLQKIWDTIPKPTEHQHARLVDFFNVEVVALSSRRYEREQFEKEVTSLKHRLFLIFAQEVRTVIPATGYSLSCQTFWEDITKNKELNLPAHKILVASKLCGDIADNVYSSFETSQEWHQMKATVESGSNFSGFQEKLSAIIRAAMDRYDESETMHFDKCVRLEKRDKLSVQLVQLVKPIFEKVLRSIKRRAFEEFREALPKTVNESMEGIDSATESCKETFMDQFNAKLEDAGIHIPLLETAIREELQRDIDAHIVAFRQGLPAHEDVSIEPQSLEICPAQEFQMVSDTPRHGVLARRPSKFKFSVMWRFAWKAFCLSLLPVIGIDLSSYF